MHMEMRHTFTAILAIIDDQSKARSVQAFLTSHRLCDKNQVTQKRLIFSLGCCETRGISFWG